MGEINLNIKNVAIFAIIALVVLFAGNYLINYYQVDRKLETELTELTVIEGVEINKEDNYQLDLTLADVSNLQQSNLKIREKIEEILGTTDYQLQFSGEESASLEQVYDAINLALYEALETGEFVKFGTQIKEYQQEYNLDRAEVKVDDEYIYLTLANNDGAIYKVLNRTNNKEGEKNG
jgi:hypothetical protein